jgi:hypothetical protein
MYLNKIKRVVSLQNIIEHIVLIGLIGTMVIPSIRIGINFYLDTFTSLLLMFLLPFLIYKHRIFINRFVVTYMFVLLAIYTSIVHSYLSLQVPTTYRDYMELFKYFQTLPFLLIISTINYLSFTKKAKVYMEYALAIVMVISFLEYTNIGNLASTLGSIYSSAQQTASMLSGNNRLLVTGGNPNNGALIATFFLIYSIYTFSIKKNIYNLFKLIALFTILLMTQSRTVLIGFLISYFFYILLISKLNIITKVLIVSSLILLINAAIYALDLQYIIIGLETAVEGTNNSPLYCCF